MREQRSAVHSGSDANALAVLGGGKPKPVVERAERLRIERLNRQRLERDLLEKRLVFESRPYEAHIQYSNFCNMSCVMCYNGRHPPLLKMPTELLEQVRNDIAPSLSVVIPYGGSEPLALTWDAARDMAEQYSIDLDITTNVQFLDPETFDELKDITETLVLSIDSHIPEVFQKIRLDSKPDKVFENLAAAAKLAERNGIECLGQIVFMTENASTLPETVAYLADVGLPTVKVLQMIDINGESGYLDPLIHFSASYVDWIKHKCIDAARRKGICLIWNVAGTERHDFRNPKTTIRPTERKNANHTWEQRMKHYVPGYCHYVWNKLQVTADGGIAPCGWATDGELVLGNLTIQNFEDIWTGPNSQDLRRAHLTWDYPALCKSCRFTDLAPPEDYLPFVGDFLRSIDRKLQTVDCTLLAEDPLHMARQVDPPTVRIAKPDQPIDEYVIVFALGGESGDMQICRVEPCMESDHLRFDVPAGAWAQLTTNLGYWWALFGLDADCEGRTYRSSEIRCIVRHEAIPRIEGSALRYPDQGFLPAADLGGKKEPGWSNGQPPQRPELGERRLPLDWRPRSKRRQVEPPADAFTPRALDAGEYRRLIHSIRASLREVLPSGVNVLVVSKGDDELLKLEGCEAWHFPSSEDGRYAGYHPRDSDWAIGQLKTMCRRGADYLLIPVTVLWWLDHYAEFASHLRTEHELILDDPNVGVLFSLRPATFAPRPYRGKRESDARRSAKQKAA